MSATVRADWLLSRASHYRETGAIELAKATALAAQAEATLALAEQQRLGNVIEYMKGATAIPEAMTPEAVAWAAEIMAKVREGILPL